MANPADSVRLYAVGDIQVERDEPETYFDLCRSAIKEADIAFGQVETNYSERGCRQVGTRFPARSHPRNAPSIKNAGFTVASLAGNHCLDWGPEALQDTIDILKKLGLKVVGVGKNIAEARTPVIAEAKGTRIGFLAYNAILPHRYWAEENTPGCAPIRGLTLYEQRELEQPGTPATTHSYAHAGDKAAMLDDIRKLRSKVDVLVLSLHFGLHFIPAEIADYQIEYTHAAIDAGVDLILGHHAHILKGIEVYKGKAIFYSLCNFGFDLNLPREELEGPRFKVLMRLNPSWTVDPEYLTYPFPADSRMTGMVKCNIVDKKIKSVCFAPAYVNPKGQPRFVRRDEKENKQTLDYMNWLCEEEGFNTRLTYDGDDFLISAGK